MTGRYRGEYRSKYRYTCKACGHLFRSEKALALPDRICGMCQLKSVYGEPKREPKR